MNASVNTWQSESYRRHAAFVPALGAAAAHLLAPRHGERILDVGCGDGSLTLDLAAGGATVVGIDSSRSMVEAARARGVDARLMDAESLPFDREFDAVFSNAALHWVHDHDRLLEGVARTLKPGGRFVAEFGGHGNIAAIQVAVRAVLGRRNAPQNGRRYYPTDEEYRARLEAHGFVVDQIGLIPRPTPLPTGMRGWLEVFERSTLDSLGDEAETAVAEMEALLRPSLCDSGGRWTADYVRIRFRAVRP